MASAILSALKATSPKNEFEDFCKVERPIMGRLTFLFPLADPSAIETAYERRELPLDARSLFDAFEWLRDHKNR